MRKIFTFLPALFSAGVLSAGQLTSVGLTVQAPKIDGKLNDPGYTQTLPVTGSVLLDQSVSEKCGSSAGDHSDQKQFQYLEI